MAHFVNLKSMKRKPKLIDEYKPREEMEYPPGLRITLCKEEIEALDLDLEDCEPDATIHLCCNAKVVRVHKDQNGPEISLQITDIGDDDEEDEEEADEAEAPATKRYAKEPETVE